MIDEGKSAELGDGITSDEPKIQARDEGSGSEIRSSSTVGENQTKRKEEKSTKVQIEDLTKEDLEEIEVFVTEMNKRHIPSFNSVKLKKKYPKAYKALFDFIEEKGQYQGQLDDATMVGIMAYTSRMITFDFFDSKEIYVCISGDKQGWDYIVSWKDELYANEGSSTRTLTEITAFDKAFEILENQLK